MTQNDVCQHTLLVYVSHFRSCVTKRAHFSPNENLIPIAPSRHCETSRSIATIIISMSFHRNDVNIAPSQRFQCRSNSRAIEKESIRIIEYSLPNLPQHHQSSVLASLTIKFDTQNVDNTIRIKRVTIAHITMVTLRRYCVHTQYPSIRHSNTQVYFPHSEETHVKELLLPNGRGCAGKRG